jgi:serine/threonine-protein kinase
MGVALSPGSVLGAFRIEEQVGEGSFGVVYRAVRDSDRRDVALKVLREELGRDPAYLRRFAREASVASEVRHANIVPVLDAGEVDGLHFVATAYVSGGTLARRLTGGQLRLPSVLQVAEDVAAGLTALHRRGLVHRDVKPANVMLDADTALLTDFGLATGAALTTLTRSGLVVGTPQYLAPELLDGTGEATPVSDVYALGCLVYACLAGKPPFTGSAMEVAFAQLEREPADPCTGRADVPAGVSGVVLGALAKEPGARPRSATMFGHLLRLAAER